MIGACKRPTAAVAATLPKVLRFESPKKAVTPSNMSSGREVSFMEPVEKLEGKCFDEVGEKHMDGANVVEPVDVDAVKSPVVMDKFDGDFSDVALVMDGATPERQWTEEEIAALKPEQCKDVFKVPGSFNEAWNRPCPSNRRSGEMVLERRLPRWSSIKFGSWSRDLQCQKEESQSRANGCWKSREMVPSDAD